MKSPQEQFQLRIDKYAKEHDELCLEIARLNSGDSSLMVDIGDYSGNMPEGEERVAKMLHDRLVKLSEVESQLAEYCRISGMENPIPPARRVV